MGIMDDAKDMKKKADDRMDSSNLDDKAREEMEKMRRERKESGDQTDQSPAS